MKILNIAELLLLASLWGGSFLFMRIASPVLGPIWLVELRVLLAGLTLLPFLLRSGCLAEVRKNIIPLFLIGCFNSAIPFSLFAFASVSLPAGFTSILNATTPMFGTLVASVWWKEKLTRAKLIGFVLGFTGVVILVGWRSFTADASFFGAVVAGLSASLMYAIAAPYIKQRLAGVPSVAITTVSLLSAAVFLLPVMPFTMPSSKPEASVIFAVLGLALFSTALAYILFFRLIKNIGSTKALTVAYLIPIFAMLWGAIVLNETITASMLVGCGLIFTGTALANEIFSSKS